MKIGETLVIVGFSNLPHNLWVVRGYCNWPSSLECNLCYAGLKRQTSMGNILLCIAIAFHVLVDFTMTLEIKAGNFWHNLRTWYKLNMRLAC